MALRDANIGVYVSKELAEYTAGAYADYGSTKDQLHHFARAIEAEVRKQDEALIRQLVEALENSHATLWEEEDDPERPAHAAITAARARLGGGKP